jgi:hypothetical protein
LCHTSLQVSLNCFQLFIYFYINVPHNLKIEHSWEIIYMIKYIIDRKYMCKSIFSLLVNTQMSNLRYIITGQVTGDKHSVIFSFNQKNTSPLYASRSRKNLIKFIFISVLRYLAELLFAVYFMLIRLFVISI